MGAHSCHLDFAYIRMRAAVLALRLITPLSVAYIVFYYFLCAFSSSWLAWYTLAETLFFFGVYVPRSFLLQKEAQFPLPPSRQERQMLFTRSLPYFCTTDTATGWFYANDPVAKIKKGNLKELLLWAFFNSDLNGLQEEWKQELDEYVAQVEKVIGHELPDGRNDDMKCKAFTRQTVRMTHRPLLLYLMTGVLDFRACLVLWWHGFTHLRVKQWWRCFPLRPYTAFARRSAHPKLGYWYRPHRSATKLPILFLHGVGMGLTPYLPLLCEIVAANPDVGIIAIEDMPISMRITSPHLNREEMLQALTRILDYHDIPSVVVVGHSYGTFLTAHILHDAALSQRVAASMVIDPASLLIFKPDVNHNFFYRSPRTATELFLWYFACQDPDIARGGRRGLFFTDSALWKEDLAGRRVGVVLGGNDLLLDANETWRYLTGQSEPVSEWRKDGLDVLFYPNHGHSETMYTAETRAPIHILLSRLVDRYAKPSK
ncbi:uncharacterized protein LAESUDRAFT_742136 [Laetiporus sulphureus 93-53]|uniref:AB hydrolase-1 domain-containing protein n=1 Tax=Laetiporus sulphureus 93-53 TaxID=1314785 RepID=A0A165FS58_9APHY|nr:uncharacterized protein LAESUDRAFT_742136 [Laetiporus sulphureus 93-53]KZT09341.1 hypothetical protein LAESUDRAFT_742136 [Laetiporus sulphureus 93-53]